MDGTAPPVRYVQSVAALRFFYGTMGSGKSTQALQIHHNLVASGHQVLLTTQLDRQEGKISSRLGVAVDALAVTPDVNLYDLAAEAKAGEGLDAMICDEAQFYESTQIEQLARVVDDLDVEVYAYGLLTSFQGTLFAGSQRLLELADAHREIQVEARCWCGGRATHNARLVNGRQVYSGILKVVGDTDDAEAEVTYQLMCRKHWMSGLREREDAQLPLLP